MQLNLSAISRYKSYASKLYSIVTVVTSEVTVVVDKRVKEPNPPVFVRPAVATPTIFAAGIDVKLAADSAGNVPVKFAAGTFVKFAADIAGKVPVMFAAGILVRFAADKAGSVPVILAAGILVRFAADKAGNVPVKPDAAPERVVAVHTPVTNKSPSGLIVAEVPTFTFPEVSMRNLSVPSFV